MLLLHLSDIHFRSPDCLTPAMDPEKHYRTKLILDARQMVLGLESVGAILVTGDIAFKGAADEYQSAAVWVDELASEVGCRPECVWVVPGNHDVDRTLIQKSLATRNAQDAIVSARVDRRERTLRDQISDPETGRALVAPLAAYNEFATKYGCQVYLPEQLLWTKDLDFGHGAKLRITGLTSTLLSGRSGDDHKGSLYLSPLQTVLDPCDDVVHLVMSHHPPDWLMDHEDVDENLYDRAALHLFGHKHRLRATLERQYARFSAGAVNPERGEAGWQPGYNLIDLKLTGDGAGRRLSIEAHIRQWQSNPGMFRAQQTTEGESVFKHSLAFAGAQRTSQPKELVKVADDPPGQGAAAAAPAAEPNSRSVEGAMGEATTRNLVYRFWKLKASDRREIALALKLITQDEIAVPEPARYGRALRRAGERGQLEELAREVEKREMN
ncbi:MAG: metallophosphoesterase [Rubrivivax sp.]|nr:metallophosphoesterase [Rubrivivax sp.]